MPTRQLQPRAGAKAPTQLPLLYIYPEGGQWTLRSNYPQRKLDPRSGNPCRSKLNRSRNIRNRPPGTLAKPTRFSRNSSNTASQTSSTWDGNLLKNTSTVLLKCTQIWASLWSRWRPRPEGRCCLAGCNFLFRQGAKQDIIKGMNKTLIQLNTRFAMIQLDCCNSTEAQEGHPRK